MNRSLRILALAGTAALGAGCTDLVLEPKSAVGPAQIFAQPSAYRSLIAKVYAGLAVSGQEGPAGNPDIGGIDEGFSQYIRLLWKANELPTDEAVIAWNDGTLQDLNTQIWGETNGFVTALYYRIYFQIALANEFLVETSAERLDRRGVTGQLRTEVEQYRAEARFLRALSYWHAIDFFGDVPFVDENTSKSEPPAQADRAVVWQYIVDELNAVRTQLPPVPQYGRAGQSAADMLLAKLYLNSEVYTGTARWTEARVAAENVIGNTAYSLDPTWRRIFSANNNTSPEMIFPVTADGQNTQSFGSTTFLINAACGANLQASDYGTAGCWWGLRVKPEILGLWGTGDIRDDFFVVQATDSLTSITSFDNGRAAPKYTNRTSTGGVGSNLAFPDTDFPMFRLADAYLMYAEAVVRGGGGSPATALGYVNALRTRASASTISQGELTLPFILDERVRELMWEAHRRTDLVRFGLFTGGTRLWSWKGGILAGRSTEPFRDLYPIPASELSANPRLTQNPGY